VTGGEAGAASLPDKRQQQHARSAAPTRRHGTEQTAPTRHASATVHVTATMVHSKACAWATDSGGRSRTKRALSLSLAGDGDDGGAGDAMLFFGREGVRNCARLGGQGTTIWCVTAEAAHAPARARLAE